MDFIKMHGLGNDFIIVDTRAGQSFPGQDLIVSLSNRKTGIGCDQFIVLCTPENHDADVMLKMFNADGSVTGACGNATRCVGDLIAEETGKKDVVIQTEAGLLYAHRENDGRICVDMGVPKTNWADIPLARKIDTMQVNTGLDGLPDGVCVNVGNPHCVFFMTDDVTGLDLEAIGPRIEHHALFPERVNAEFINVIDESTLRMRVWERGAGETDACGTGACASVVAAALANLAGRHCRVILNGGNLDFHWREEDGHILMTGPVAYVFKGSF